VKTTANDDISQANADDIHACAIANNMATGISPGQDRKFDRALAVHPLKLDVSSA
jgi:hypothetical protein